MDLYTYICIYANVHMYIQSCLHIHISIHTLYMQIYVHLCYLIKVFLSFNVDLYTYEPGPGPMDSGTSSNRIFTYSYIHTSIIYTNICIYIIPY
jgi:hypothetical protein